MEVVQYAREHVGDRLYFLLVNDERRRHGDDVSGGPDQHAPVESRAEGFAAASARGALAWRQFDGTRETDVADIDDVRFARQGVQCLL